MQIQGKPPRRRRIASILNRRLSAKQVRELVELLYVNYYQLPHDRILYANDKHSNLYRPVFDQVEGVDCQERSFCGRKLELFARKVDNLLTSDVESDNEALVTWTERDPVRKIIA